MSDAGRPAPPKPWERTGATSSSGGGGLSPFAPPSATNSTAEAVAVAGTVGLGNSEQEKQLASVSGRNTVGRPVPSRPWSQQAGYQSGYGVGGGYGMGGGGYGMGGGAYGGMSGGAYGGMNSRYGSMYGGSNSYGTGSYGYGGAGYGTTGSMYGGGSMYGNRFGSMGGMGGYGGYGGMGGMNGYGAPGYGIGMDPNDPAGPPRGPPTFWQNMLQGLHHFLSFFGRLSILVDENTHAVHFFMTALLQLCDRAGVLYGELARFVLRLLGVKAKRRLKGQDKAGLLEGPPANMEVPRKRLAGREAGWDNLWGDEGNANN